ncbi:hypothetical protein HYC85_020010, partial [Camellia sinensis]
SFKRVFEDGEQSIGFSVKFQRDSLAAIHKYIVAHLRSIVQRILKFRVSLDLAHLWRRLKGPVVANTVIGQGNTTSRKMCGLDKSICLTVFFDISSSEKPDPLGICRG